LRSVFKLRYDAHMATLDAADRLDILELLGFYCRCIDTGLWDELPKLFTADCRIDGGPIGSYEGTAGVEQMAALLKSLPHVMRHYVTNVAIRAEGNTARTHAYVLAFTGPGPGQLTPTTGFYEDELVKRDGRWLFRRRNILLDLPRG